MRPRHRYAAVIASAALMAPALPTLAATENEAASGAEVVKQCAFKPAGKDQKSRLTVILRDKEGSERKHVYLRFWKDFGGVDGVAEKMVLFTEFPPDAKGAAFMRWGYTKASDKNADQWIYLPVLKKNRRVTIRDPNESFLGSDLTYRDISPRELDDDTHKLLHAESRGGSTLYLVESASRKSGSLYSKTQTMYVRSGQGWANCAAVKAQYFDNKGELLKRQQISWQQVGGAWVWDKVQVENVQTGHASMFQVSDVNVNVGLKDDIFTERTLQAGP